MDLEFPYQFDTGGRTAQTSRDQHIRDLIELVLFTQPGERVNRPDLGSGLQNLVFAPLSDELVATTQFLVQGTLEQWLGDLIQVIGLGVNRQDSTITVTVQYVIRSTQQAKQDAFKREYPV